MHEDFTHADDPRDPITYDAVAQICATLTQAGDRPTVRRVQSEVGGSNTTILNHLRRWQDTQRAAASKKPHDSMFTESLRAALFAWSEERASQLKEQTEGRIAELEELYAAAKDGWEQAEARIGVLEEQAQAAETQLLSAAQQAEAGQQKLEQRLAGAEARAHSAEAQLAELKEHLAHAQQAAEAQAIAAAEARTQASAATGTAQSLAAEADGLRTDHKALTHAHAQAEQRAAVAEERAKNRDEQLAEVRRALEGQHKAAAEAQAHALTAAKELSAAQRELLVSQNERGGPRRGQPTAKCSGQGGGGLGGVPQGHERKLRICGHIPCRASVSQYWEQLPAHFAFSASLFAPSAQAECFNHRLNSSTAFPYLRRNIHVADTHVRGIVSFAAPMTILAP